MSIASGPNLPTNGLILSLDAANIKSFRGEPTTNYLATWMDGTFASWSAWADGGGSGSYQVLGDISYEYKVRFTNSGNTGRYALSTGEYGTPNTKRTFSIYVKPISVNNSNSYLDIYCDYGAGISGITYYHTGILFYLDTKAVVPASGYVENIFAHNVGDGWYRIGFTTIFDDSGGGGIYPILYDNSVVDVAHPQLEYKDYVTPFVTGTRGSTVATGGGWADLSGNQNHGIFSLVTFDSRNLGSIFFNGAGDHNAYISTLVNIEYSKVTISFWAKFGRAAGLEGNATMIFGSGYYNNANFSITQHASNYTMMFTVGVGKYAYFSDIFSEINKWYHFIFVYDSDQASWADALKTYVDGQERSIPYSEGTPASLKTNGWIYMGLSGWAGFLNNICVYTRTLTPEEALQNYNAYKGRYL